MQIHLLDTEDNGTDFTLNTVVLSMPEIDMYIDVQVGGAASISTRTDEELLSLKQIEFDSDFYSRISNSVELAPVLTEEERGFKKQLLIMKAISSDKISEQ